MPLPSNLKYNSKVEASPARSYRQSIPPNGPTSGYNLGDTISFNIPTRNNLFMVPSESYLEFDLVINNTSGGASTYRLDSCGIHGLFQKVVESHSNNTITNIDNYGLFAKMMFDLQSSMPSTYGKMNVLTGSRGDFVTSYSTPASFAANTTSLLPVLQINSGELLDSAIANGSSTAVRTYCVNLISALGALCPKQYIPLFAMTAAPITLALTLVSSIANFCACTSATGTISISNIQFVAQFIELSDIGMSELLASLPDQTKIQFPLTNFKNFYQSYTALGAGSQISIPVPAKYASLKSYIVSQRGNGTGAATYFPFSSIVNNISSYQFKIGPHTVPNSAPSRTVEMFAECLKCLGSISDLNYVPNIDYSSYTQNTNTALTDTNFNDAGSGSFYIGLDLENFPGANKDSIFAGYNSTTDDTYLQLTYNSTGPSVTAPRFDIFACYDSIFICENGVAYIQA